jgi:hypothetical protein
MIDFDLVSRSLAKKMQRPGRRPSARPGGMLCRAATIRRRSGNMAVDVGVSIIPGKIVGANDLGRILENDVI